MRLNKSDKEAFVRAVMDDVPEINYDELINEATQNYLLDHVLPAEIAAIYRRNDLRPFLERSYTHMPGNLCNVYSVKSREFNFTDLPNDHPILRDLRDLKLKQDAQHSERRLLENRLKGVIEACSTLKSATERLPKFVAYLPADRDGTGVTGLPAISDVVAVLVAAGWPKGKTQGEAHGT